MTKKELMLLVGEHNLDLSKATVESAVHLFFEIIAFYLKNHHRVELRGLGSFSLRYRGAHNAHNPKTGEAITVPEKWVPFFRAGKTLKDGLKLATSPQKEPKKSGFFFALPKGSVNINP